MRVVFALWMAAASAALMAGESSTQSHYDRPASIRDAVVVVDGGCSGVCIDSAGLVVTVKHCEPPARCVVTWSDGRTTTASRVYVDHDVEGCVVLRLDPAGVPYPYRPVATAKPEPGDVVRLVGYRGPSRQYHERPADVLGSHTIDAADSIGRIRFRRYTGNVVAGAAFPGMSGGPVFNDAGQVCGLISSGAGGETTIVRFGQVASAVRAYQAADSTADDSRPVLVAFVTDGCAPCMAFKRDVDAGRFRDASFDVEFVKFDQRLRVWSDGGAAWTEARPALQRLSAGRPQLVFPVFWIRGTDSARVGYQQQRGLIQWAGEVVRAVASIIAGGPIGPPQTPAIESAPDPLVGLPPPPAPDESNELDNVKSQVATMRDVVGRLVDDLGKFRDAGVIGKALMIDDLKRDTAAAKRAAADAKATASRFRDNPVAFVWSILVGLVSGLATRKVEESAGQS